MTSFDLLKTLIRIWNDRNNPNAKILIAEVNVIEEGTDIKFFSNMSDEQVIFIMEQHMNRVRLTNPSAFNILESKE